jgi:hypothetical protein
VSVLDAHRGALARMGAQDPRTLETQGRLEGLALRGEFHAWHDGDSDRFDQSLGARNERSLRIGDREYIVNASGNVRELVGSLVKRQRTQDFILSADFANEPQYSVLLGRASQDGHDVVQIRTAPPGGDSEVVSLDAKTQLIDAIAFDDADGTETITYADYRVVHGALVAFTEIDSDGDHAYDLTQHVATVNVNRSIDPAIFVPPPTVTIQTEKPVTVSLTFDRGHIYVPVTIRGHDYRFLLDTGSQAVVVDSRVAAELVLVPQGMLQVRGARRVSGIGIASLDDLLVAGARLPLDVVSIVDLNQSTEGAFPIDGVLGYPFFAAADARIDLAKLTMTFGQPGSLPVQGDKVDLDTDRELPEIAAKINGTPARMLVDTGNSTELLVFNPFLQAHPGLIQFVGSQQVSNYGVGGSMSAVGTMVDELDLGPYRMFNRYTNLMLGSSGAFADRIDGGNVGLGTLKNFVVTFDLANRAMYLLRAGSFDDGRYRPHYQNITP